MSHKLSLLIAFVKSGAGERVSQWSVGQIISNAKGAKPTALKVERIPGRFPSKTYRWGNPLSAADERHWSQRGLYAYKYQVFLFIYIHSYILSNLEFKTQWLQNQSRIYTNNLRTLRFKDSISSFVVTFMRNKYRRTFKKKKKTCMCSFCSFETSITIFIIIIIALVQQLRFFFKKHVFKD